LITSRIFTILVVDDILLMCDFLYKVISSFKNCKVFKATDGRSAVEILENETIDMLITDIEMNAPNGLELLKKLRSGAINNPHDIPVLMFSGNTYKDLVLECLAYDVNDFLAKPVSADGLKKKVLFHLQHEKHILDAEHYKNLNFSPEKKEAKPAEPVMAAESYRSNVSIVRPVPVVEYKGYKPQEEQESETLLPDLVIWPENTTTGFHQLDRRMSLLAQRINFFHCLFVKESKAIALATELKRICDAIDYLFFVGKKLQKNSYTEASFWQFFNDRMQRLLALEQDLAKVNPRHHSQIQPMLKRISYWWVQTMNRPFIHPVEESEHHE
jgi:DNA-binding response OmpR family regulator